MHQVTMPDIAGAFAAAKVAFERSDLDLLAIAADKIGCVVVSNLERATQREAIAPLLKPLLEMARKLVVSPEHLRAGISTALVAAKGSYDNKVADRTVVDDAVKLIVDHISTLPIVDQIMTLEGLVHLAPHKSAAIFEKFTTSFLPPERATAEAAADFLRYIAPKP